VCTVDKRTFPNEQRTTSHKECTYYCRHVLKKLARLALSEVVNYSGVHYLSSHSLACLTFHHCAAFCRAFWICVNQMPAYIFVTCKYATNFFWRVLVFYTFNLLRPNCTVVNQDIILFLSRTHRERDSCVRLRLPLPELWHGVRPETLSLRCFFVKFWPMPRTQPITTQL
jgi:hypothetical protein